MSHVGLSSEPSFRIVSGRLASPVRKADSIRFCEEFFIDIGLCQDWSAERGFAPNCISLVDLCAQYRELSSGKTSLF